jgi:hypothetical protein
MYLKWPSARYCRGNAKLYATSSQSNGGARQESNAKKIIRWIDIESLECHEFFISIIHLIIGGINISSVKNIEEIKKNLLFKR